MDKGGYRQINKALNICAFEDYLSAQQAQLPKIVDVEQLSSRVIRILGQNAGKVINIAARQWVGFFLSTAAELCI